MTDIAYTIIIYIIYMTHIIYTANSMTLSWLPLYKSGAWGAPATEIALHEAST